MKMNYDITFIIPVYNEQNNIEKLFSRLFSILQNSYTWEIIFIDDGSTDESAAIIKKLIGKHNNISLISFSRNYGHQIALSAGYHFANGKAVISMDSDLQHPPEFVPTLIKQWEKGYEVVLARRKNMDQQTFFKRNTSRLYYYFLNKISGANIIENIADFRLLDKKVVDYLKQFHQNTLFWRGIVSNIGFNRIIVEYEETPRESGEYKYNFSRMIELGLDGIISFSSQPLRISTYFGFAISLGSIAYAVWIVIYKIFHETNPGIASILVGIFFLGGIQLICLGILGEYIAKIFQEVKQHPLYTIKEIIGNAKNISHGN